MSQEDKDGWEKWIIRGLGGIMFIIAMQYITTINSKLDKYDDRQTASSISIAELGVKVAALELRVTALEISQRTTQTVVYSSQSQPIQQLPTKGKK